jgi:hypothetical protein
MRVSTPGRHCSDGVSLGSMTIIELALSPAESTRLFRNY